jgi:hypothetical protein
MALYKIDGSSFQAVPPTKFSRENLMERSDIQAKLCRDITPIGNDLLVLAEEFSNWQDSNRRIDLLCLKENGALVVVELKRDEIGGHMELQALRYAAMVSTMTFEQAIESYSNRVGCSDEQSRSIISQFLRVDSVEGYELSGRVEIILAAADFSTEITTTALWLNEQGLSVKCIRLRPYNLNGEVLVDVQSLIPLPETQDYLTKIRTKRENERVSEDLRIFGSNARRVRFWTGFGSFAAARGQLFRSDRVKYKSYYTSDAFRGIRGIELSAQIQSSSARVFLYIEIDRTKPELNQVEFERILSFKSVVESAYGGSLVWDQMQGRNAKRVYTELTRLGLDSPESEWDGIWAWLLNSAEKLEAALKPCFR